MATSDYVDVGGRKNDLSLIERPSSRTPGGIEMWIFILGDMTVFAGFFYRVSMVISPQSRGVRD